MVRAMATTPTSPDTLSALLDGSRRAAQVLACAPTRQKNDALEAIAEGLRRGTKALLAANGRDMQEAARAGKPEAFLDRLRLNEARVEGMAKAVAAVAALEDPVGTVTQSWRRPNGLEVRRVRLPLGVVLMIFEARPNVTSDAAALCLKSGNAAILRGGSEAFRSNQAVAARVAAGVSRAGLPAEAVQLVPTTDRASLVTLLGARGRIDLCIPRGGPGLIQTVAEHARIPVVEHAEGVCHVYVHADADAAMAERIIVNAKTSRPGVCNAAECLLVDRAAPPEVLPRLAKALVKAGVTLKGCEATVAALKAARVKVTPAEADDFGREFLALTLAVKVVDGLDGALSHIERYGSEHTEAIVTRSRDAARRFTREVAASAVVVNASTRFNDGGELGLGAEIGISTSRLHAFGPMGLTELTSQKYVLEGDGQVR
jgi:glutamate-5-semialdehyde dehydrogenase